MRYDGPIIDVHHHFWNIAMGRHTWLGQQASSLKIVGDSRYLQHDFLPPQMLAGIAGEKVIATVHVEAHWDRTRDGLEETAWLESIDKPANIANRYVVWADLAKPDAHARIRQHLACSSRVAGVRESIRFHEDPALSYAGSADWRSDVWQRGVAALAAEGLLLELLIYPENAEGVCEIARMFPQLKIVVNHSVSPIGAGDAARQRFMAAVDALAQHDNIFVKASNYFRYSEDLDFEACMSQIARPLLHAFGPHKTMFASDYPVSSRWKDYAGIVAAARRLAANWSAEDQQAFFCGTAARVYGVPEPH